jgi:acyl-CoA thioesterase II
VTQVDAQAIAEYGGTRRRTLAELFELHQAGPGSFEAPPRSGEPGHSFGGATAAQALFAAARTVAPGRQVHSVHCHFLRPGDTTAPTRIEVESTREGRSYATRSVVAEQHGRETFAMTAAFQVTEPGWHHQVPVLDVPAPEDVPTFEERATALGKVAERPLDRITAEHPFEYRFVGRLPWVFPGTGSPTPRLRTWLRSSDPLPEDPATHASALLYVSDLFLLSTSLIPHVPLTDGDVARASLDHTVWFHQPTRVDEWLFFDMDSSWAGGGRALCNGRVFDRSGALVATVAQEVMIRPLGHHAERLANEAASGR